MAWTAVQPLCTSSDLAPLSISKAACKCLAEGLTYRIDCIEVCLSAVEQLLHGVHCARLDSQVQGRVAILWGVSSEVRNTLNTD